MMKILPGFPDDIVAVQAQGRITQEDYQNVLVPATEEKLKHHGRIKILYAIGLIDAFDFSAIWEDTAFGVKHWSEISHAALVTDYDWIKSVAIFFTPFFPGEIRMFKMKDLDKAREWLTAAGGQSHQKVA